MPFGRSAQIACSTVFTATFVLVARLLSKSLFAVLHPFSEAPRAKRSKAGAVSFEVIETMEASDAPVE